MTEHAEAGAADGLHASGGDILRSNPADSALGAATLPPKEEADQTKLYYGMFVIRRFEEKVMELWQDREVTGSVHLCIGQEAVPVGACQALLPDDVVTATYRGHGWAIAKGVPLRELFAEVLGRDSDICGGRGGSAYLTAPAYGFLGENSIVGAGVPIALGAALALNFKGSQAVSVVSIGDGAMNQGSVHEALNMAAVLSLPLIVVVENNGYAEMTRAEALTAVPAHRRAAAYGIRGLLLDGNDALAVQAAVSEARHLVLSTRQPVLLEAITHRLVGHYSGDLQAYRPSGELEAARQNDPLRRLAAKIGDSAVTGALAARATKVVDEALDEARGVPLPDPANALSELYAELGK